MDKKHAKFILQSYRPDGADVADPDFQEALQHAAEDRELGQWLAQERSHDSIFVDALVSVSIPEALREEIIEMMEYGDVEADMSSDFDALFVGAMSEQVPPAGLRDQILSAMEVEKSGGELVESNKVVKFPTQWLNVAAAAAVAVLGITFIYPKLSNPSGGNQADIVVADDVTTDNQVVDLTPVKQTVTTVDKAQSEVNMLTMKAGMVLNASYEVDMPSDSFALVNTWLEEEGMPIAKAVPEALISLDVKGGKKVTFDNGIEGSLILFNNEKSEDYYLMVLDLDAVKNSKYLSSLSEVGLKKCYGCPLTKFNTATWKDSSEAYFLLTKSEEERMLELF